MTDSTLNPTLTLCVSGRNAHETLATCLQSIEVACQGFEHRVDVLIVDDASTDNTPEIAQGFCATHPQWTFHQLARQGGVSAARNYGFHAGRGDFIWHIDSDDTISPSAVAQLVETLDTVAIDEELDVIVFSAQRLDGDGNPIGILPISGAGLTAAIPHSTLILARDYPQLLLLPTAMWLRVYRRTLFDTLGRGLIERSFYQDLDFNTRIYPNIRKAYVLDAAPYDYWEHPRSAIRNQNVNANLQIIGVFESILTHYESAGLSQRYESELEFLAIHHILHARLGMAVATAGRGQTYRVLKHYMNRNFPRWRRNKYLSEVAWRRRASDFAIYRGSKMTAALVFGTTPAARRAKATIKNAVRTGRTGRTVREAGSGRTNDRLMDNNNGVDPYV